MGTTCKIVADIVLLFLLILTVEFGGDTALNSPDVSDQSHTARLPDISLSHQTNLTCENQNLQRRMRKTLPLLRLPFDSSIFLLFNIFTSSFFFICACWATLYSNFLLYLSSRYSNYSRNHFTPRVLPLLLRVLPAQTTQLATVARIQVEKKVGRGAPPVGFPVLAPHAVSFLMQEDSGSSRDITVIWTWHVC